MKIGIIIIFYNNIKDIDKSLFINQAKQAIEIEFCLVNNNSTDNTYVILKEIKEACKNVSLVNIKKSKPDLAAVRAGARYMFNEFNFKHIGYVNANVLNAKHIDINNLIKTVNENQDVILKHNIEILEKQEVKRTLFQSIFSVLDYLKDIQINNKFQELQKLSKL
ncbi:glycosyltransferase [uncultured Lacinutrix sp.]|uniref:glycosyltransferase n=1 Tax=uncultured Lacinutrix sp. TaxID=574032 RepID=UPI00260C7245|nr:glycosyltransferase [uncultured Lacinutrix sp.]